MAISLKKNLCGLARPKACKRQYCSPNLNHCRFGGSRYLCVSVCIYIYIFCMHAYFSVRVDDYLYFQNVQTHIRIWIRVLNILWVNMQYIGIYIYIYICPHTYIHTYIYMGIYVHIYICPYIYMSIYICPYIYIYMPIYICAYIYIHVCLFINKNIYICMYAWMYVMYVCMDGWMYGCMDVWMYGCM